MDTITSETTNNNATSTEDKASVPKTLVCMLSKQCAAGGDDGGHIFDQERDDEPGNAWCRCGMDVITYTCWYESF